MKLAGGLVRWWQQSIGLRIIGLFLGLLLAVQLASFTALRASLSEHAHRVLPEKLREGERLFQSLLERKAQTLIEGAKLLATDYGFREALSSDDADTIASVLANHGARIGATEAALLSTDFKLRAATGHPHDLIPVAARLASQASGGRASVIALLSGRPYQAVLVPVRAPVVIGWVLMAFPLDMQLVKDMSRLSTLDLTVLSRSSASDPWNVSLTSLDVSQLDEMAGYNWTDAARGADMVSVLAEGEELGVRAQALTNGSLGANLPGGGKGGEVLALVSLSVDEAVRIPLDLQFALLGITLVGIAVFAVGSVFTVRRVTTPLRGLADAAERLGQGDYVTPMRDVGRNDEIGELSQSFETMRKRIAENQEEILKLAYWDSLTGLPNRAKFRDAVRHAIEQAAPSSTVSIVMLDLNRFKHVNDVLGYRVGDLLLKCVAERLTEHLLRDGDVVARVSGDEFGVLLRSGDAQLALAVAHRIEQAFDAPIELEGHQIDMGAGIGIACWPEHADDGDSLLNRAEVAMYAAKRRSAGPLSYDPSIDVASAQTLTLMSELRQAVERNELLLYLQPKLALRDGRVVGAEALVRWQHPTRGMVPPMQFIPFAEQTGFIRVLTLWIFEEAARQWSNMHRQTAGLTLSVNLSTRDLMDQDLPEKFAKLLAVHEVPATAFCLEITESAIMDDPERALGTLDRLSAMGFKLSIDDFGTGYSSLAYLKRLPVDELKIDQSFVRTMRSDDDDAMIVKSTIDLAHNLGIIVVAEGVETKEIWDMLRDLKCDQAQGYHMGRPMPVVAFPTWAEEWATKRRTPEAVAHVLH